jgi:predicted dehydrogenase
VLADERALVVGAGSIGLRHHRVLEALGLAVDLVSRRPASAATADLRTHSDLRAAIRSVRPSYVVIANETAAHLDALSVLGEEGFAGTVLVEKPFLAAPAHVILAELPFCASAVGYQLRFHPLVSAVRDSLEGAEILTLGAAVGQHLAIWRPGRAMADTSSARLEDGGGVLRDLSHELDLVLWLAGGWKRVCALGGRSGALGPAVMTDDRWGILLEQESGAVTTIQIDALDHVGRRSLSVVAVDRSIAADLLTGSIVYGGSDEERRDRFTVDRDEVFSDMHRTLLGGAPDERLCSLAEGMAVVELIDAVERSVATGGWVVRDPLR